MKAKQANTRDGCNCPQCLYKQQLHLYYCFSARLRTSSIIHFRQWSLGEGNRGMGSGSVQCWPGHGAELLTYFPTEQRGWGRANSRGPSVCSRWCRDGGRLGEPIWCTSIFLWLTRLSRGQRYELIAGVFHTATTRTAALISLLTSSHAIATRMGWGKVGGGWAGCRQRLLHLVICFFLGWADEKKKNDGEKDKNRIEIIWQRKTWD